MELGYVLHKLSLLLQTTLDRRLKPDIFSIFLLRKITVGTRNTEHTDSFSSNFFASLVFDKLVAIWSKTI